jgi:hypothetical protein
MTIEAGGAGGWRFGWSGQLSPDEHRVAAALTW